MDVPAIPKLERVGDRAVVDHVAVALRLRVERRVEGLRHFLGGRARGRRGARVHSRPGRTSRSSGARRSGSGRPVPARGLRRRSGRWRSSPAGRRSTARGRLRGLLNGPQARLALPAVKVGAVVAEGELDVPHRERRRSPEAMPALRPPDRSELEQLLGDLHGVGGRSLAEVVADAPEEQRVGPAEVLADAADEDVVLAGGGGGQGIALGRADRRRPSRPARRPRARVPRSAEIGRSVSTRIDSLCEIGTGTRTQVGLTSMVASPMILRVSLTIFISSLV